MSTLYHLKFAGQYIRLTFAAGQPVAETCSSNKATPFISEADAWQAVSRYQLTPALCTVEPANEVTHATR